MLLTVFIPTIGAAAVGVGLFIAGEYYGAKHNCVPDSPPPGYRLEELSPPPWFVVPPPRTVYPYKPALESLR